MKKLFTSLALSVSATLSFAQIGAVAPDFTVSDINGTSHNLYSYLNAGKVVILDVSATWCNPCWGFHNAHYLEDLYTEFGPNGTNEVVILFYEGDADTGSDALNGTGGSTQGDWVTGTPYPIMNETPLQLNLQVFAPLGFPTVNVICPSDRKIKADLWDIHAGSGTTAQKLEAMRTYINTTIDDCAVAAGLEEATDVQFTVAPNPATDNASIQLSQSIEGKTTVQLYSVSGQLIRTEEVNVASGTHEIKLNLAGIEAGSYFVQVQQATFVSPMIALQKK